MDPRRLRRALVEGPRSAGERSRQGRWSMLAAAFPDLASYAVLDLGGTVTNWLRAPVAPASVTIVNLVEEPSELPAPGWISVCIGDACEPAALPSRESYDLVYSNSLLEHVGGHARRQQLADVVHRSAPRHWVQTPYRYFPVEPHWLFPGMQFLPLPLRARIAARWPLAHTRAESVESAVASVQWTDLIGQTEMRHYFPDSTLLRDRFWLIPKSLIAVRGHRSADPSP